MFLTSCYVLRPVTGVGFLVVEKTSDTELFRGSSVPTGPIPGAGGLVPEDAVQPVAMFSTLGRIFSFSSLAVYIVRIITHPNQPESSLASID